MSPSPSPRYFVIAAALGGPAGLLDHVERKHGTAQAAVLFHAPADSHEPDRCDDTYGCIEFSPP